MNLFKLRFFKKIKRFNFEEKEIDSIVPGSSPVKSIDYKFDLRGKIPFQDLQTKRWVLRNVKLNWNILDLETKSIPLIVTIARQAFNGKMISITELKNLLKKNLELNKISNFIIFEPFLIKEGFLINKWIRLTLNFILRRNLKFDFLLNQFMRANGIELNFVQACNNRRSVSLIRKILIKSGQSRPYILIKFDREINDSFLKEIQSNFNWLVDFGYSNALILDNENVLFQPYNKMHLNSNILLFNRDDEPAYVYTDLKSIGEKAANVGAAQITNPSFLKSDNICVMTPKFWNYGVFFPVYPVMSGPAIIEMFLQVTESDVGISCLGADLSTIEGEEIFLHPGTNGNIELKIYDIEKVHGIVIRKGPTFNGRPIIEFSVPTILIAVVTELSNPPISVNPNIHNLNLQKLAKEYYNVEIANEKSELDIVESHDLGFRLGMGHTFQPPLIFINSSIKHLKMEIHDSKILAQIYRLHRPLLHLEFGTWEGFGTLLCLNNSDADVWTINLPDGEKTSNDNYLYINGDTVTDTRNNIGRLFRDDKYLGRVTQLLIDSRQLEVEEFEGKLFDSVLIDGGHTYDVVVNDTEKSLRLIRAGGLIIWHDFCPDPSIFQKNNSISGVVEAIIRNWGEWSPFFSDIFWVRPSFLLIGIANGKRPE